MVGGVEGMGVGDVGALEKGGVEGGGGVWVWVGGRRVRGGRRWRGGG